LGDGREGLLLSFFSPIQMLLARSLVHHIYTFAEIRYLARVLVCVTSKCGKSLGQSYPPYGVVADEDVVNYLMTR